MNRIFLDIETAPLVVYSWSIGRKVSLSYENILTDRRIICICWKTEGQSKVNSLSWENQNDKKMLLEFAKVISDADELVGHNIRGFDLGIVKARCAFHEIQTLPKYTIVDTLSLARSNFRFVSNRLDYLGQYLGVGEKIETGGFNLWKEVLQNSIPALNRMIKYCKGDVELVERVYNRILMSVPHKTHAGVLEGNGKWSCAKCASTEVKTSKKKITASGAIQWQMNCKSCGGYYTISDKVHEDYKNR